jgi:hypothetical protein
MVIEPREGRVLHGLNANELMDVQDETFQVTSMVYVTRIISVQNNHHPYCCVCRSDPIDRSYFNFLKKGLASL